jgi:hypothetical protein
LSEFRYTIINDVTARDLQKRHQQWFIGKSCDTFCPMGPGIVPASEINGNDLQIQCWINDELRQVFSDSRSSKNCKVSATVVALASAEASIGHTRVANVLLLGFVWNGCTEWTVFPDDIWDTTVD